MDTGNYETQHHRGLSHKVGIRLLSRTEEVLGCAGVALVPSVLNRLESFEGFIRELVLLAPALFEAVREIIHNSIWFQSARSSVRQDQEVDAKPVAEVLEPSLRYTLIMCNEHVFSQHFYNTQKLHFPEFPRRSQTSPNFPQSSVFGEIFYPKHFINL